MIYTDYRNRTTYFLMTSGCWIGISDRSLAQYGIDKVFDAIRDNNIKIFFNGKWDYLLKHATMM